MNCCNTQNKHGHICLLSLYSLKMVIPIVKKELNHRWPGRLCSFFSECLLHISPTFKKEIVERPEDNRPNVTTAINLIRELTHSTAEFSIIHPLRKKGLEHAATLLSPFPERYAHSLKFKTVQFKTPRFITCLIHAMSSNIV